MNKIVGVMGPGETATDKDIKNAFLLGKYIAGQGWVLLTGGRNAGVMHSASKGAKANNGITVGILPGEDYYAVSEFIDIPIITGLGNARNNINVLSSQVIVACGTGPGTASEIALGIKAGKEIILLSENEYSNNFFSSLDNKKIHVTGSINEACELLAGLV